MIDATPFYKFLNPDGRTPQLGFQWPLDGSWLPPVDGKLIHCERGYHVVTVPQFGEWMAPELWEVQVAGEINRRDDKCVVSSARLHRKIETWNARTQRIFAADCAEHVLHNFTKLFPHDSRPLDCIKAMRLSAEGKIDDAAESAAESAAWSEADTERKWQEDHLREMLGLYEVPA